MSIIIPNGGHVINDATASTENVTSGKIFYNNDGRKIGTMSSDLALHKSTIQIPADTYTVAVSSYCVHTVRSSDEISSSSHASSGDKQILVFGAMNQSYTQIINCPTLYVDKSPSKIEYIMYNRTKYVLCEYYSSYGNGDGSIDSIWNGYSYPALSPSYVLAAVSSSLGLAISLHASSKTIGSIGLYRISKTNSTSPCTVPATSLSVVYHD